MSSDLDKPGGVGPSRTGTMSAVLTSRLRALTPARIGLRRAGTSLATGEVLDFQLAHARARDAVHAALDVASVAAELRELSVEVLVLHSAAADRQAYLQRPDLGRRLNESSRRLLVERDAVEGGFDLAIVIADGLSALAVERHGPALLGALLPGLAELLPGLGALKIAPVCLVEQGRVAVGDEICEALDAAMVVVLIGERPGLSSADSLGAYITWQPHAGKTSDAGRNCISNIRLEGLSYADAAARLIYYIGEARRVGLTGVALKDPDSPNRPAERLLGGAGLDGIR